MRLLPGPWWVRALLGTLVILLVGELATLPFALAIRSNALEYGLTNQSLGGWLRDWVISLLVSLGVRRRSRCWSCWSPPAARRDGGRCGPALAGAVLTVLGSWVYPVVVEPLFNHFTSLPQGELRTEILALARRRRRCRSPTCWWPTRRVVRRP